MLAFVKILREFSRQITPCVFNDYPDLNCTRRTRCILPTPAVLYFENAKHSV